VLVLDSLLLAGAGRAAPALLIADGAEDAASRAALASAGVEVLGPAETATVVESASASGVSCGVGDVACWQAVATLAGHDDVILITGPEVVVASRGGVRRGARLVAGIDGVAPAVSRLFGRTGALIVELRPGGELRVDDAPMAGGVADGLGPGPHVVSAAADGFIARRETLTVVAGEVQRVSWTLEPAPEATGASLSPTLLYGGLGVLGLGVDAGGTISTVGWFANGCDLTTFECPADTHDTARALDVTAIALGAGLGLVGVGSVVASTLVE
jgi:hypothetical protein